jgi:hypothetical protein
LETVTIRTAPLSVEKSSPTGAEVPGWLEVSKSTDKRAKEKIQGTDGTGLSFTGASGVLNSRFKIKPCGQ